jgi:predicted metallo-beta-lactamase superfamily hydrolase
MKDLVVIGAVILCVGGPITLLLDRAFERSIEREKREVEQTAARESVVVWIDGHCRVTRVVDRFGVAFYAAKGDGCSVFVAPPTVTANGAAR